MGYIICEAHEGVSVLLYLSQKGGEELMLLPCLPVFVQQLQNFHGHMRSGQVVVEVYRKVCSHRPPPEDLLPHKLATSGLDDADATTRVQQRILGIRTGVTLFVRPAYVTFSASIRIPAYFVFASAHLNQHQGRAVRNCDKALRMLALPCGENRKRPRMAREFTIIDAISALKGYTPLREPLVTCAYDLGELQPTPPQSHLRR